MNRLLLVPFLLISSFALWSVDLATDSQASITVRTRTEFAVSVDDPSQYGLASSIPELAIYYSLSPWQKLGSKPNSSTPTGFLVFDLDAVQLRYTNGQVPDYNSPSTQDTEFGFNDPADTVKPTKPGNFGPVYMPNMRSGITWGDWTLQLATAGGYKFSTPWNHEYEYANTAVQADWALLDSRVQYRRGTVAQYLSNRKDETNYWSYDSAATPNNDLSSILSNGPLVGLEYAGPSLTARLKGTTQYTLTALQSQPLGTTQGLAFGSDLAYSPIKPLTLTTSLASRWGWMNQADPDLVATGARFAYTLPLTKGLDLMPVLGYDVAAGLSGTQSVKQEVSASLTVKWPGSEGWFFDLLHNRTGTVFSGATLAWKGYDGNAKASTDPWLQNLRFSFFEDQGDAGLVKGLGSEWVVEVLDMTGAANLSLSAYGDWTFKMGAGRLVHWVKTLWDNTSIGASRQQALAIESGLKLDQLIPKVLLGVTWESGNLIPGTALSGNGVAKIYAEITL